MSIAAIPILKLYEEHPELQLKCVSGQGDLNRKIFSSEINRPGLSLTGFFDYFAHDRIQIFGMGEWAYLNSLDQQRLDIILSQFFSYELNSIIFTHGNIPQEDFLTRARKKAIPVFFTPLPTNRFIAIITEILNKTLAPRTMRHGVMVEVFGVGTLLTGKSGVGKSETALELIERGHRLVADDMVEIRRLSEEILMGTCSDIIRHHMEIRGLGIINIKDIFGAGSVREQKVIELIIHIEEWSEKSEYDRTGMEERFEEILDVPIPVAKIPLRPGRNLPIIVETAAMNQRLKRMGKNAAKEFSEKLVDRIRKRQS